MTTINNSKAIKLKDIGRLINSDKIYVIIIDNDGNELYNGPNPFKSSTSPLAIQFIYDHIEKTVIDMDAGLFQVGNDNGDDTACICIRITVESRGLFNIMEKTLKAEKYGSRSIVSIYKNNRPIKTGLVYINDNGEFNANKIDALSIYQNADVKKIENSYNEKGYKEIIFHI